MSGYEPIGNGKEKKAAERIELDAVSGLRFFATLCLVSGRAIENLWMDSGTEAEFLSLRLCTGLHLGAKDVVSFYYILSGFTMTWGYISRLVFLVSFFFSSHSLSLSTSLFRSPSRATAPSELSRSYVRRLSEHLAHDPPCPSCPCFASSHVIVLYRMLGSRSLTCSVAQRL